MRHNTVSSIFLKSFICSFVGVVSILIIISSYQTAPFLTADYQTTGCLNFLFENFYWIILFLFVFISMLIPISLYYAYYVIKNQQKSIQEKFLPLWVEYEKTFITENENPKLIGRTRANADLYFNEKSISSSILFNMPVIEFFKLISGTFVGLGVLGTFVGFSQFLNDFVDSGITLESTNIFVGLKIAFNTSIIGLLCSIIYNFLIFHPILHLLKVSVTEVSDNLDKSYYVTDEECMRSLSTIVGMTERSVEKNIKEMIAEVKAVITEERTQFTSQVLSTADLLKNINEALDGIPEKVNNMCIQLNSSIETAKNTNEEMLNFSISSIQNKVEELFTRESELTMKTYTTMMDAIKSDFSSNITSMKESFESLVSSTSTNSKNVFELSINAITKISAELCDYIKKNNTTFITEIQKSVNQMEILTSQIENTSNSYKLLDQNLVQISTQIQISEYSFVEHTEKLKGVFSDLVTVSAMMKDSLQGFLSIADLLKDFPKQQEEMRHLFLEASRTMEQSLNSLVQKVAEVMDLSENIGA